MPLTRHPLNQMHDLELASQIQRAGWFIPKQDLRVAHQCLAKRDDLLLPSAQFRDKMTRQMLDSQHLEHLLDMSRGSLPIGGVAFGLHLGEGAA
jgi:hypothetical protein